MNFDLKRIFMKDEPKRRKVSRRRGSTIARYEFPQVVNKDGGVVRRPPRVELGPEESISGGGLNLDTRYKLINGVRDLMRNSSLLKIDISMLQLNTIGTTCNLQFFDKDDEWYRDAERIFHKWAKHASFRDGTSLVDVLDKVLYTLIGEGDCVLLFDGEDGLDTGKITLIPPDQIQPMDATEFERQFGKDGWTQSDGVIRDSWGRTVGVIVSPKPGLMVAPPDSLVLLKDDPYTDGDWIFVKRSFRDTVRGVADVAPILSDVQDVDEILEYSKICAKKAAAQYAYINEAPQESAITPEGFIDDEEPAEDGTENPTNEQPKEYTIEHLQDVTGGMMDLLPNGSSVTFSPNDKVSPNTMAFVEALREQAGGALGLARSFSLAKADSSYTAARWDTGVSAKSSAKLSAFLDNQILDWLASRVIDWHIRHGLLDEAPDEDWIYSAAFEHPTGREVLDEQKEISANSAALKAGLTNFSEILGPSWKSYLRQLAKEKKFAESLGLALDMGETKSGQVVNTPTDPDPEQNTDEEK